MGLAETLLIDLKNRIASLELEPSSGGAFEVFVDRERIWSKLETDEFPDRDAMLAEVQRRAG